MIGKGIVDGDLLVVNKAIVQRHGHNVVTVIDNELTCKTLCPTQKRRAHRRDTGKGACLATPGVVNLSEFAKNAKGAPKVVLQATQGKLLKLALQMARDDYETRRERQGIQLAKATGRYLGRRADSRRH